MAFPTQKITLRLSVIPLTKAHIYGINIRVNHLKIYETESELLETSSYYRKLLETAVLAGEIMISSGAETHRVEDTMQRMLSTTNFAHAEAFIFPTGIIATLSDPSSETLSVTQRVPNRAQNFGNVCEVNAVSRKFCAGKMTLDEAYSELKQIKKRIRYPEWGHMLGYVFASSAFALMFGGKFLDALGAIFAGFMLAFVNMVLGPKIKKGFITTILAAMSITIVATIVTFLGKLWFDLDFQAQYIIIGAMMPLVPGLAMTNAFRDILHGDFLSAGSRIIEALMVAVCVAIGVGAGIAASVAIGLADTLMISFNLAFSTVPDFFVKALSSGIAIFAFYFVFDCPPKYVWACGFNAFFAWAVYLIADHFGVSGIWASFFSTIAADVFAYYCARIQKAPVIIFLVAGILPMVPGIGIYSAVYALMFSTGDAAVKFADALFCTGAIALAIFITDTFLDVGKRIILYAKDKKNILIKK